MSSWNYSYLAKAVYRFALLICLFEKNPPLPVAMFPLSGCASILAVGVILGTGMVTPLSGIALPTVHPTPQPTGRALVSPQALGIALEPRSPGPCTSPPSASPLPPPAPGQQGGPMACPSHPCLLPGNLFPRFEAPRLQPCPGAWSRRISMACLPFMRGKRSCLQNIKWLGRCGEAELLICQHLLLLRSWHRLPSPLSPYRPPPT